MEQKASVLIVSSSNTRPESLIKLITKSSSISGDFKTSNYISHPWTLETKYYTVDVDLVGITEQYVRSEEFNDNVEALIIHMDSNKETGLEDLAKWAEIEEDCEPEIKLLLANYCDNTTKITKVQATEWCLKRGFELIELYPSSNTQDPSIDDIIEEKFGVDRVIEALQAHAWSNLVMKDKQQETNCKLAGISQDLDGSDAEDDFSNLFAQLSVIKDSFQSMPMNQRKQCAEQVVTAFWKAIGGDEEEIAEV